MQDVTGYRGEKIAQLCLTEYSQLAGPMFWPTLLGDKWPAVDLYVELLGVQGMRPYCLMQCKATGKRLSPRATGLRISTKRHDIQRLLQVPGPTYILGVHEPTRRVFAKSVHAGIPERAITKIEWSHELTGANLQRLYNEVREYWRSSHHKPTTSVFA